MSLREKSIYWRQLKEYGTPRISWRDSSLNQVRRELERVQVRRAEEEEKALLNEVKTFFDNPVHKAEITVPYTKKGYKPYFDYIKLYPDYNLVIGINNDWHTVNASNLQQIRNIRGQQVLRPTGMVEPDTCLLYTSPSPRD